MSSLMTCAMLRCSSMAWRGQWFGLWMIAALHPVNALVLTYSSLSLARRSNAYWVADAATVPARPSIGAAQSAV